MLMYFRVKSGSVIDAVVLIWCWNLIKKAIKK